MKGLRRAAGTAMAAANLGACLVALMPPAVCSDCTRTSVGLIPLSELGTLLYQGNQGGLYGLGRGKP